jgi:predicted MFS family arabinose efflux permease
MESSITKNEQESVNKRIYIMFCITNIILNIDQGVLPAATVEMMRDLNMNKIEFGLMGSLMYIGLISGSLIAGFAYQKFSCKNVLMANMLLMSGCLSFFTFTTNLYILGISRIFTGFFQVI